MFLNKKKILESWVVVLAAALIFCFNVGGYKNAKKFVKVTSINHNVGVWDINNWDSFKLSHNITRELRKYINTANDICVSTSATSVRESGINEQIAEEIKEGEIELLAQLVEAEAGNQDMKGKRLVADVVLNRIESDRFPNTIEEVIFQESQFSCIEDGNFEKSGWKISEDSFEAARLEYENRLDSYILFFTAGGYNEYCVPMYKHGAHYFGG